MPFSVTCPSCGKSFQLAQEIYERKVAGKIVSIKCKQCQSGIRIDATESGTLKVIGSTPAGAEAAAPTGAQAARARQATLIGMMGPSGKPVTASTNESGALWAVDASGAGEDRELDDATIAREIGSGAISADTLVWRDGMGDWLEVSKIPELAKHLPSAKKPEPAKVAAPLPAARGKQPSAPEVAAAAPAPAPVKAPAPAVNPAPAPKAPATAGKPAAPTAKAPAPAAPAAKAPAPAAKPAAPAIPSMVSEDDDEEATMIFRSSAEAVAKLGLDAPASEEEAAPAAPRPAAGRPVVAAPLPAAGRPAAPAAKAPSAPLNPAPAAKAPSAPLNPAPAAKAPSAPLNAPAKAPSAPLNPAPAAKAPSAPLNAPPPLPVAAAPAPPPLEPAAPPAPPPPPRAKQPSAPGLPRGLTLPEPQPAPPPPPPPSPPPPPATDEPAAALPPVRPRQQSAPGWPRGLTPPPDRPTPLGGAPTPPPTAPPFMPTQNPFAAAGAGAGQMGQLAPNPFAVATTTDLDYAPPRSKTPLVIGGLVLVLAAAGIAFALMGSGAHPPPPPVPAAAPTPPPQAPTPTPAQAETQAGETPQPAHPSDDIAGAPHPVASAGGDFSQMFAAGAEKAQKGGTGGSAKAFDAEAAKTAVATVLKLVAACKEPGGPTGQSSAAVTFDASGHVSSVTIGAPFSGTSTGTCIIGAFKNASMPPFSGLPGTIAQPVSLL